MTYEKLQEANSLIKTTPIKGKEYAEVPQRIKAFRKLYPEGFILTEIQRLADGVCVIVARAGYYTEDGRQMILGMGTAYEKEGSNFINQTSYIENCETSAVGRALGMMGIGSDTSVASYEEVANAKAQQKQSEKISEKEAIVLANMLTDNQKEWCKSQYGIGSLMEMTVKQYTEVMNTLKERDGDGKKGKA